MAHLNNTLIDGDLTVTGKINNDLFNKYKLRRKYNFSISLGGSRKVTPQTCPFSYDKFYYNEVYRYLWDSGTTGLILAYNDGRRKMTTKNVRKCYNDLYSPYNNHLYLSGAPVDLNALTFENIIQNFIKDKSGDNAFVSIESAADTDVFDNYACKFHCETKLAAQDSYITILGGIKLSWRGRSIFLKPVFNYKLCNSDSDTSKYWQGDVNGYGLLLKFIPDSRNYVYVYGYIKSVK